MKFDPFAQWGQVMETWQKMADDSIARTNAFFAEVEKAEAKRVATVETAIDELAKMQKESIAYSQQLAGEWRKMQIEAFHKASTAFTPAAAA